MRILAIRGQNLASLAERFEIDLTVPPLSGTGLFAITGDTGAGKSTILDAMCLALYGDFPRAGVERREKVEDPSGRHVEVSDARNILMRGAAQGFAEVDFIGLDGDGYRARWTVRRARGKATGNLMDAERTLDRLDGAGSIATGKRDVLAAVIERSGFTFAEFRRSVLLAQGEFDAFLLADEASRADLLEKITGTGIYSAISMRVFEDTAERERALEQLRARREALGVMAGEVREALVAEHMEKTSAQAEVAAECARLDELLQRAGGIDAARATLAKTRATLDGALSAWEGAAAQRDELGRLDGVAPLRPKADWVRDRARALKAADATVAELVGQMQVAESTRALAGEAFEAASTAAIGADADIERFGPDWDRAAALDHRIVAAEEESRTADAALTGITARLPELAAIADRLVNEQSGLTRKLTANAEALASRAAHARLLDEAARIGGLFVARADLVRRLASERKSLADVDRDAIALQTRRAAVQASLDATSADRQKLVLQLEESRAALAAIDIEALEVREEALRRLDDILDKCGEAARRRDEATVACDAARNDAATSETTRDEAASRRAAAELEHGRVASERARIASFGDLADAAVSEHAIRLRSHLADGKPCPVCGGSEHPFAHDNSAAARLAREVRARRDALDDALAKMAADIVAAKGDHAAASSTLDAAKRTIASETAKAADAARALARLVPEAAQLQLELGLPGLSAVASDAAIGAAVQHAVEVVARELSAVAVPRRRGQLLDKQCRDLQARADALARTIETEAAALQRDTAALASLAAERSRLTAVVEGRSEQLATAVAELQPLLACAGLAPADLERDPAGVKRRLDVLASDYAALVSARDTDTETLRELELAIREGSARRQATDSERQNAERAVAERGRHLRTLREERAGLLGGAATATHRQAIQAAAKAARNRLDSARRERDAAVLAAERCIAALTSARISAADGTARHAEAVADFAAAAAVLGLGVDEASAMLAVPDAERERLAALVGELQKAVAAAETAHATRRADLEALLAFAPIPLPDEIEAARAAATERAAVQKELQGRLAIIDSDLARDADKQRSASALGDEIAAQEHEVAVWREVNDAIGQKDGAKFRRLAQGVTLGQLVALANVQLAALNPRYALRRGKTSDLAIDVVDRDMGDEVRSPRSLSGGERFLMSLSLALAMSGLEGRQSFVDTLFIDEGFGSLDRDTLDVAIDALERLQGQGRKVGVITHVSAMIERIPVQVRVEKRGGGRSAVRVADTGGNINNALY